MAEKIEMDDLFGKVCWWEPIWWKVENFFRNWIYPACNLKNFLFRRYDLVRLRGIKRSQYSDVAERMFEANMELLAFFVEREKPEEHICWYQNENGNDVGHRYGECELFPPLYPEYRGRFVMDIIKEVYHWWKEDYPRLCEEQAYLLSFWHEYVAGQMKSKPAEQEGYNEIFFDTSECPKTLDCFDGKNIRWEILDKYLDGDRNNIFVKGFVNKKMRLLETDIELQKQKNLHLCIEVRQYLWT